MIVFSWKITIVRELKHLKVKKVFVYCSITRYNDAGSIIKRNESVVRQMKKQLELIPLQMNGERNETRSHCQDLQDPKRA